MQMFYKRQVLLTSYAIEINFIPKCKASRGLISLQDSFVFCDHIGKCDFSFAAEYCLISHKSSDREKSLRKINMKFLRHIFTCNFSDIFKFSLCNFSQSRYV